MFAKQYATHINWLAPPVRSLAITCVLVLALMTMLALPAAAQYSVVYNFTGGSDGGGPMFGLAVNGEEIFSERTWEIPVPQVRSTN